MSDEGANQTPSQSGSQGQTPGEPAATAATVIVRGEAVSDAKSGATSGKASQGNADASALKQQDSKPQEKISESKVAKRARLPELDDDSDVGFTKEQRVLRDGKPDLTFTGTLLASAAPREITDDYWWEYRVYGTDGNNYVFSKIERTIYLDKTDKFEAEVFESNPSSTPTQLARAAIDLTRSQPYGWTDAAVKFFGYHALSKQLYRKLGPQFEEHVS